MKVLLAYQSGVSHRDDPYISLVPTGLCYLHASLRSAGYDSLLANFSAWTPAEITRQLRTQTPTLIGISQWTHNRQTSLELARICRTLLPDAIIIMGGGHATFCTDDLLYAGSPVDGVVLGEGEATLSELVSRLSEQRDWRDIKGIAYRQGDSIVTTPARERLENLDLLPLPAAYLKESVGMELELQAEFIVTTRGCPSHCSFCSSPDFWGRKVRFRSPEAIVAEISFIRQKFGLIYFSIRDDTFTADRARVLKFCSLLQERKQYILWNCQSRVSAIDEELVTAMKRAGCECIQLGVESGSPTLLRQLGKNITLEQIKRAATVIRDIGINLSIYLIGDIPGETPEDINQTIELIRSLNADDGYVSPLAYFPGTRLYKEAVQAGEITDDLFADSQNSARYALPSGRTSSRLLKVLTASRSRKGKPFPEQKARLGYCSTTNILAAEQYRQRGGFKQAEKELREITEREPGHPWGWFLLGDLYAEQGKQKLSRECYAEVLRRVPRHPPSRDALKREGLGIY